MMLNFSHEFLFTVGMYIVGGFVFVAINAFKIGQLKNELATKEELKGKVEERNKMIDRVYERFDVYKKHTEDMFVRRDMCGQLHTQARDEMKRIDDDYKNYRHEMRNQIQQIFDKIDELRALIIDRKN